MSRLPCSKDCFFCSPEGDGLKMKIELTDGAVFCDFTVAAKFQGWEDVAHAGIVTGIMDEVMWWTIFAETRKLTLTRKLETEFLRPVYCGKPYRVHGTLVRQEHGNIHVSATIEGQDGKAAARGHGLFRVARNIAPSAFATKLDFSHVSPEMKEMLLFDTK
jgi:acyl-coenzyme A thioesterase PaaI-like protein